jgi:hypothetical protein
MEEKNMIKKIVRWIVTGSISREEPCEKRTNPFLALRPTLLKARGEAKNAVA